MTDYLFFFKNKEKQKTIEKKKQPKARLLGFLFILPSPKARLLIYIKLS